MKYSNRSTWSRLLRNLATTAAIVGGVLVTGGATQFHYAAFVEGGAVKGTVSLPAGVKGNADGVVVYLKGVNNDGSGGGVATKEIEQINSTFSPNYSVVVKNTTVKFPNKDKIFHNVFSLSRPARFDLGLYAAGEGKEVKFRRPGLVEIYCNIHPDMVANVLVVEDKNFAVADASGKFSISDVPPGSYEIHAYHPTKGKFEGAVVVEPGGTTSDISLSKVQKKKHARKDGTPYGRYK